MVLEIQRSFDYYQTQLHQPAPVKLIISVANAKLAAYLTEQLGCPTEPLALTKILNCKKELNAEQTALCLNVIGGALDKGINNAKH